MTLLWLFLAFACGTLYHALTHGASTVLVVMVSIGVGMNVQNLIYAFLDKTRK